jgi:hypothetical protein
MAAFVQRASLEPLLVTHGVNVVFSGHEHIYQRSTLVGGVQYFVSGGAGSLRPGDGARTSYIARTYSGDYHFMLVEIEGDLLHFQAISRTGRTIDAGTLSRVGRRPPAAHVTAWAWWAVGDHGDARAERAHPVVHGTDVAEEPAFLIEPGAGKDGRGMSRGDPAEALHEQLPARLADTDVRERGAVVRQRSHAQGAGRAVPPDANGVPAVEVDLPWAEGRSEILQDQQRFRTRRVLGPRLAQAHQPLIVGLVVPMRQKRRQQAQRVHVCAWGSALRNVHWSSS